MKNLGVIAVLLLGAFFWLMEEGYVVLPEDSAGTSFSPPFSTPASFDRADSSQQVQGQGVVARVLSDDVIGSRHQRFILELASGQTILVAHNIDLAPRVPSLREGDTVEFYGEYEWNDQGGVVHWTHHDPNGRHQDGWLKAGGRTYQ